MAVTKNDTFNLKVTKNLVYYNGKNYGANEVIPNVDVTSAKEFLELGVVEVAEKEVALKGEKTENEGQQKKVNSHEPIQRSGSPRYWGYLS